MTVKNEADQLIDCLDDLVDLFSQIEIIDTGSTDDTVALLRQRYGVEAKSGKLEEARCFSLCDLRNQGFEALQTPWILCLDADERIEREELQAFLTSDGDAEGYFTPWRTFVGESIIEDYKLSLFKKGYKKLGLVHDNVQASFREQGAIAEWYPNLTINHHPPVNRSKGKHQYYEHRLHCAIAKQSRWVRYYWFLGYRQFCKGDHNLAEHSLKRCFDSESIFFPVEVLNSAMVLVEIYSLARDSSACHDILTKAAQFYQRVENDFEVKINSHALWLEEGKNRIAEGEAAPAPGFAY